LGAGGPPPGEDDEDVGGDALGQRRVLGGGVARLVPDGPADDERAAAAAVEVGRLGGAETDQQGGRLGHRETGRRGLPPVDDDEPDVAGGVPAHQRPGPDGGHDVGVVGRSTPEAACRPPPPD
jgi:hypothetical protein